MRQKWKKIILEETKSLFGNKGKLPADKVF
jgi:hypothetical protein